MATLVTKNSSTASAVPGAGDLVQGELAVNVTDKRLFTKNAGGSVVEVGTNPSSLVVTGDVGIGTSSPSANLHVAGTFRQNDATSTYGYTVTTASNKTVTAALFGGGYFAWQTNASGTDQLTLDSSGNLGIGISSPQAVLHVNKATTSTFRLSATNVGIDIQSLDSAGYGLVATYTNHPLVFSTNATERARITSAGDLLVGTTATGAAGIGISNGANLTFTEGSGASYVNMFRQSNSAATVLANGYKYTSTANGFASSVGSLWAKSAVVLDVGSVIFYANGATTVANGTDVTPTERARITSAGDLLVGTGTVSGAGGLTYLNQGATGFASINNNNAGATGYVFSSYRRSSVEIGSVTQNGTTAVLFNTTSDRRLKENIVPAPSASAVIDAIEIVSHDWKSAPDEHVTYGVIAQDLALVAPQAVLQGDDGDEIEKAWGVDYSKLVPMLIKEIQSLRARVAALEQV